MRRFPAFRLCAAVLLSLCCAPLVHAGTYPDHPIKMLTMTKPGAQIDLLTRAVAEKLKASLGQPVLVSNVPGGSHGSVMATELAFPRPRRSPIPPTSSAPSTGSGIFSSSPCSG